MRDMSTLVQRYVICLDRKKRKRGGDAEKSLVVVKLKKMIIIFLKIYKINKLTELGRVYNIHMLPSKL